MKTLIVSIILCTIVFFSLGCEESITPQQIQTWTGSVDQLSARIDEYQETTVKAVDILEADGMMSKDVTAGLNKIGEEIDRVQPQLAEISESIKTADLADKGDLEQWIEIARKANVGTRGFNPYAGMIEVGLGGAAGLLGLLAAKKNKDAKLATAKYRAHKHGVERAELDMNDGEKAKIYDAIAKARADLGVS